MNSTIINNPDFPLTNNYYTKAKELKAKRKATNRGVSDRHFTIEKTHFQHLVSAMLNDETWQVL